jgi:hypothetical protein
MSATQALCAFMVLCTIKLESLSRSKNSFAFLRPGSLPKDILRTMAVTSAWNFDNINGPRLPDGQPLDPVPKTLPGIKLVTIKETQPDAPRPSAAASEGQTIRKKLYAPATGDNPHDLGSPENTPRSSIETFSTEIRRQIYGDADSGSLSSSESSQDRVESEEEEQQQKSTGSRRDGQVLRDRSRSPPPKHIRPSKHTTRPERSKPKTPTHTPISKSHFESSVHINFREQDKTSKRTERERDEKRRKEKAQHIPPSRDKTRPSSSRPTRRHAKAISKSYFDSPSNSSASRRRSRSPPRSTMGHSHSTRSHSGGSSSTSRPYSSLSEDSLVPHTRHNPHFLDTNADRGRSRWTENNELISRNGDRPPKKASAAGYYTSEGPKSKMCCNCM